MEEMNKMALTNKIELQFNKNKIDEDFSIFAITTDEKFIKKGAELLDDPYNELKAVSIAFDYGRLAWIMFRKSDNISSKHILDFIEKNEENKSHFTVQQKSSWQLNKDYLLFRLFLYSLNLEKKEKYAFNNLTGKLFISNSEWIHPSSLNALQIDVDWQMNLSISFTTFTKVTKFRNKSKILGLPRYTWSGHELMLKRTFSSPSDDDSTFVHAALSSKFKPHMDFYNYYVDKRKNTKVYYAYFVLNLLKERYQAYFNVQPHFSELGITSQNDTLEDKKYMDNVIGHFVGEKPLSICFLNLAEPEHDPIIEKMKDEMSLILQDKKSGVVADLFIRQRLVPEPNTCYIVLHHNADYYKDNDEQDPYANLKRDAMPIQSVTIEDSQKPIENGGTNKNEKLCAFYKTILKELVIKNDIINRKTITLDKWTNRGYQNNWVFGVEQDEKRFLMRITPDGDFVLFKEEGFSLLPFQSGFPEVDKAAAYLRDSRDKTKSIVVDDDGNSLILAKSGMFIMPKEKILSLDHSKHNRSIIDEYFSGGYDTTIYQCGNESFYSSGIPHNSDAKMVNSTNIYGVKVLEGNNTIASLLKTFGVPFVRLEQFTVLPFPFKYVREYADMQPVRK